MNSIQIVSLNNLIAVDTETCSAFNVDHVIGSKVLDKDGFLSHLEFAFKTADFPKGSALITLPKTAYESVSAGDGLRSGREEDYVLREHRGRIEPFLKREHAGDVNFLAAVVYTREGYLADPEVDENDLIGFPSVEYVIVAVIAASAPEAPPTPYRLVSNIAGNNAAFILPNDIEEQASMAKDWVKKAKASKAYWDKYCVVAD